MEADATDATLELTIVSIDNLTNHKHPNFLSKSSSSTPFAIAWIDPTFKRSTKTVKLTAVAANLHFPLSPSILRNPSSVLTIQILVSRLPFQRAKIVGAASLSLASVRLGGGEIYNLQVRKSSGRGCGSVRVKVRILWCLGNVDPNPMELSSGDSSGSERFDFSTYSVDPSAPPMSEERIEVDSEGPMLESGDFDCRDEILKRTIFERRELSSGGSSGSLRFDFSTYSVDLSAPPMSEERFDVDSERPMLESGVFDCRDGILKRTIFERREFDDSFDSIAGVLRSRDATLDLPYIVDSTARGISGRRQFGCLNADSECLHAEPKGIVRLEESGGSESFEEIRPIIREDKKTNGKGVWRSFLMGMVSGTFAAILVGVAGLSEN